MALFDVSWVIKHIDGITALAALVGLGIFATLKGNQRAFMIIEIMVVALLPLSIWPMIISSIGIIWTDWLNDWFQHSCGPTGMPWICNPIAMVGWPTSGDQFPAACVMSATVAAFSLNTAFFLCICITAVTDKVRGNNFLPVYPGDPSPSAPGSPKNWYLFGGKRTPAECATIFFESTRKLQACNYTFIALTMLNSFEPTIWAIFRGIIAVYTCIGLVVSSVYSALSEAQLRGTLTVTETMYVGGAPFRLLDGMSGLYVASLLTASNDPYNFTLPFQPKQNPPLTFSGNVDEWQNPTPGFWATEGPANFNISWTGEYSLVTWVTSDVSKPSDGYLNSTQVNSTNPVVLAPFKKYSISLIGIEYKLPDFGFVLWIPDVLIVDGVSEFNTSMAMFSFNNYQNAIITRDFSPPSMFSSAAHVLSEIGGTLSFIDGLFALVFGRTIVAIIFGTCIISPFGLLGLATHNRFKRLIHEQYPRMQEDIDHGGMAAYISEVAIDAALINKPSAQGHTSSAENTCIEDETEEGHIVGQRNIQVGSGASYLRLPYVVEELGDVQNC
ncbi:hypothetical protein FIBSPDRAFT_897326 [Athelia psychrophila]|uniref:Uncharacterized protein n=1 Tax=Athelia psychrophila TaxID=1759441 RepID=A0A166CDR7_9AGAM|nr:hypothetical protein FIBSPDRAFT_897326 [Fibularhizoctonia sp. CBS 109695]